MTGVPVDDGSEAHAPSGQHRLHRRHGLLHLAGHPGRDNEAQSEDVYSASLHLHGLATAASQPPLVRWGQLAAGVAVGLALAVLLVVALTARRRRPAPASAP